MKNLLLLVVLCLPGTSFAKTEIGKLDYAQFRIDVPDNWNHSRRDCLPHFSAQGPGTAQRRESIRQSGHDLQRHAG